MDSIHTHKQTKQKPKEGEKCTIQTIALACVFSSI